jgi:glyoxylase-like metal-dependent hydrolase (beta-lactamase superfamily II)
METTSTQVTPIGEMYVFESDGNGFNTKTVFYDDGKEVVAFDAQFTEAAAEQAIDFLRAKTQNPIRYLVVTHPNPDKFNGIPAFRKVGAEVVMSNLSAGNMAGVHAYKKYYFVEMAKMFTDDTYPKLTEADITFEDTYEIALENGGKIMLTELKRSGVSTNQTIAHIMTADVLVVGDLVHHRAHAWLEGPIVNGAASYVGENWINTLKTLEEMYAGSVSVYGGRGEIGALSDVVPQQIAYLQKAERITRDYVDTLEGATLAEKKANVDYARLQKIFEEAFPGYGLGYMILYGAYGIVGGLK